MLESKPWYTSKAIIGIGFVILGFLLQVFGITDSGIPVEEVAPLVDQIISSIDEILILWGSMLSLYGRMVAKTKLTL